MNCTRAPGTGAFVAESRTVPDIANVSPGGGVTGGGVGGVGPDGLLPPHAAVSATIVVIAATLVRHWMTMVSAVLLLIFLTLLPTPADAASPQLDACRVPGTVEAARCATLEVYENRTAAAGRKIPIKVVVFPAKTAAPAPDPLFILAGGPGQSATEFAGVLIGEFAFAHERRDIVFVDQRGTGGSNPLQCSLGGSFDAIVQSVAVGVDADLPAVRACRADLERRADLRFYTTPFAMDDMEDVRTALGYDRINLWAASYGTRAALVYMRQHPGRVRSAILRALGGVDLKLPATVASDGQRALDRLFGACAMDAACRTAYPNVEGSLREVLARLEARPTTVQAVDPRDRQAHTVRVDHNVFGTTLFFLLFASDWSKEIPRIVHAAAARDYAPLAAFLPLSVLTAAPVHWGMRRTVLCAEDIPLVTEEEVRSWARDTTVVDGSNLGLIAACKEWPAGELPKGYSNPVETDVPILAISGEEDPVLPPHRAEDALQWLPNATHVVVPGAAHGPGFPGCTTALAKQFLESASGKALDTSCALAHERPPFTVIVAGAPRGARGRSPGPPDLSATFARSRTR
jgi:pimeloyl-ACP methyl ester carboxylesterase